MAYGDLPGDLTQLFATATDTLSAGLGGLVQSVVLETAYLPPMMIVGGQGGIGETPTGQPTFDLGAVMRPKLTVQLAAGSPIVYAPYGDPGEGSWLPLIMGIGIWTWVAYRAGQKSKRG